jgi:hypothetical protein
MVETKYLSSLKYVSISNAHLSIVSDCGYIEIVRFLLDTKQHSVVDVSVSCEMTAGLGYKEIVEFLFSLCPRWIMLHDVVRKAAQNGHIEIVRFLLDRGADPHEVLAGAISGDYFEIVEMTATKYPTILVSQAHFDNYVLTAINNNYWQIAIFLLDREIQLKFEYLQRAVWNNCLDIVRFLLDKGVPCFRKLSPETTNKEIARLLSDRGF